MHEKDIKASRVEMHFCRWLSSFETISATHQLLEPFRLSIREAIKVERGLFESDEKGDFERLADIFAGADIVGWIYQTIRTLFCSDN